jgi:hypothetical protein
LTTALTGHTDIHNRTVQPLPSGRINGQPEAFLAHETELYVAVAQLGIVTSPDQGRSWQVLYREAPPAG